MNHEPITGALSSPKAEREARKVEEILHRLRSSHDLAETNGNRLRDIRARLFGHHETSPDTANDAPIECELQQVIELIESLDRVLLENGLCISDLERI